MNTRKAIWGAGAALALLAGLAGYSNLASQRRGDPSRASDGLDCLPRGTGTDRGFGEPDLPRAASTGLPDDSRGNQSRATSVSFGGIIDSAVKERHGLSGEEFVKCQMIVSDFWKGGREWMRRNCYFDEGASTENTTVYRIPAMNGNERGMLFDALRGDLESIVDHQCVEEVVESISQSDAFAGFGRFDAELRFSEKVVILFNPIDNTMEEVVDSGNASVSYFFQDPATGRQGRRTTGHDLQSIEPIFGRFGFSGGGGWDTLAPQPSDE